MNAEKCRKMPKMPKMPKIAETCLCGYIKAKGDFKITSAEFLYFYIRFVNSIIS